MLLGGMVGCKGSQDGGEGAAAAVAMASTSDRRYRAQATAAACPPPTLDVKTTGSPHIKWEGTSS